MSAWTCDLTDDYVLDLFFFLDHSTYRGSLTAAMVLDQIERAVRAGADGSTLVLAAKSYERALDLEREEHLLVCLGRL